MWWVTGSLRPPSLRVRDTWVTAEFSNPRGMDPPCFRRPVNPLKPQAKMCLCVCKYIYAHSFFSQYLVTNKCQHLLSATSWVNKITRRENKCPRPCTAYILVREETLNKYTFLSIIKLRGQRVSWLAGHFFW